MDKHVILFLLINLTVSVSFANVLSTTLSSGEMFDKHCPSLSKTLHSNNVTKYTRDCNTSNQNGRKSREEAVLKYACFVLETLTTYICDKFEVPSEYLNLKVDSKTLICPFDFSQLRKLEAFPVEKFNESFEKVLTNKQYCSDVCYDLGEPENQCIILSKVVLYLNAMIEFSEKSSFQDKENHGTEQLKQDSVQSVGKELVPKKEEFHTPVVTAPGVGGKVSTDINSGKEQTVKETSIQEEHVKSTDVEKKVESIKPNITVAVEVKPDTVEKPKGEISANKKESVVKNVTEKKSEPTPRVTTIPVEAKSSSDAVPPFYDGIIPEDDRSKLKNDDSSVNFDDYDGFKPEVNQMSSTDENKQFGQKESHIQESSSHSEIYTGEGFFQAEDSHFFFYFLMLSSVIIIGYLAFHNKNKILAYALEGSNSRRNRRRPNPARYRKLESNLEEAISSNAPHTASSSVVY